MRNPWQAGIMARLDCQPPVHPAPLLGRMGGGGGEGGYRDYPTPPLSYPGTNGGWGRGGDYPTPASLLPWD